MKLKFVEKLCVETLGAVYNAAGVALAGETE